MEKLKPCPFCGSEANTTFNTILGYQVFCTNEDCFMNETMMNDMVTEQAAITEWNRRANDG